MNITWIISILILMLFAHIVDDYYLQGWLASAKQKKWWENCDTCQFKPDPNKVVVGDTPCTWCKKKQPYCVSDGITCKSISTRYTVDPKDFKATTYTPDSYAVPKSDDELE